MKNKGSVLTVFLIWSAVSWVIPGLAKSVYDYFHFKKICENRKKGIKDNYKNLKCSFEKDMETPYIR